MITWEEDCRNYVIAQGANPEEVEKIQCGRLVSEYYAKIKALIPRDKK